MRPQDYTDSTIKYKYNPPATASVTANDLPLSDLEPGKFEELCFDLIQKQLVPEQNNDNIEVFHLKGNGTKQYGGDILQIDQAGSPCKSILYEVKREKSYPLSEFKNTVHRFLKNYANWKDNIKITDFYLFISSCISAENIVHWQNTVSKLSEKSINFTIVDKTKIITWIKNHPDIVYKYFHPEWVTILFGKRQLWHFQNYGIFNFKESTSWDNYKGIEKVCNGNSLYYINEHIKIHTYLPSLTENSLSCLIDFRNKKYSYTIFTINKKQILQKYFIGANNPLPHAQRPFLLQASNDNCYFCDISGCHIKLSFEEGMCLCDAFDVFWNEYKKRIISIENKWKSKSFNYTIKNCKAIPLLRINRQIWAILLDFAWSHDAFDTTSEWSMFDSCQGLLKIYTKDATKDLENGYHVIITPVNDYEAYTNFRNVDDKVILAWQPPNDLMLSNNNMIISPRYYWDAETTHNWLKERLIPKALGWFKSTRSQPISK